MVNGKKADTYTNRVLTIYYHLLFTSLHLLLFTAAMPQFIPGITLSESFYNEAARSILERCFPDVPHSAGILGWSSEVLGYDDLTSTDHNWGPRFQLFLSKHDYDKRADQISEALSEQLPLEFRGYPTNFGISVQGDQRAMARSITGPVAHKIDIHTVDGYFERYLGLKTQGELGAADWLSFSEHKLLAVTRGKVFHDGLETLESARKRFSYYPHDIWLYILASQWAKIGEEETFVGRCAQVDDQLGSMLIAGRLVRNLMHLCFMMERTYAPYSKWFGTAFSELRCGPTIGPTLEAVVRAQTWPERDHHLSQAYEAVARMHNDLGITKPLPDKTELHGRPYHVIRAARFAAEIREEIESEEIKNMKFTIGSVNQLVESNEQVSNPGLCKEMKVLY
jgi:hypothetical protein